MVRDAVLCTAPHHEAQGAEKPNLQPANIGIHAGMSIDVRGLGSEHFEPRNAASKSRNRQIIGSLMPS
jgi:hypothetical protein